MLEQLTSPMILVQHCSNVVSTTFILWIDYAQFVSTGTKTTLFKLNTNRTQPITSSCLFEHYFPCVHNNAFSLTCVDRVDACYKPLSFSSLS